MDARRPLALKRQRAKILPRAKQFDFQAEVVLDTDPFHLVEPFTYGIPDQLRNEVAVGSKVRVPFRSSMVDGFVVAKTQRPGLSVKPILEVANCAPIPPELLTAASEISARYATRLVDVLRLVVEMPLEIVTGSTPTSGAIQFNQVIGDAYLAALRLISRAGHSLLIAPSERELDYLEALARKHSDKTVIRIGAGGSQKKRRETLANLAKTERALILGARSAIFLPVTLQEVVIIGELSSHYWDQRAPYWNLRDVAFIRANATNSKLTFVSSAPSLEMQRLIEMSYVKHITQATGRSARRFSFEPNSFHETIRAGLERGCVLVSVADKAYSNFFLCDRCRSLPRCSCGGRISMKDEHELICALCGDRPSEWRCLECGSNTRRLIRKGAARLGTELGKAFPNVPVRLSTASDPFSISNQDGIVVATPGAEPMNERFAALVLLDGNSLIARGGLRGEELLRNHWLRLLAMTKPDAKVYLSLLSNHPISQSLITGKSERMVKNQLQERIDLHLPPAKRIVTVSGPEREILALAKQLRLEDEGLHLSAVLKGPEGTAQINIRFDHNQARELANRLFTLQRYRASTRRELLAIKFDPLII